VLRSLHFSLNCTTLVPTGAPPIAHRRFFRETLVRLIITQDFGFAYLDAPVLLALRVTSSRFFFFFFFFWAGHVWFCSWQSYNRVGTRRGGVAPPWPVTWLVPGAKKWSAHSASCGSASLDFRRLQFATSPIKSVFGDCNSGLA